MSDVIYNISSGFFDSVNGDRLYSAADMNKPYKRVIADGIFPTPQGTPSTDFQVVAVSGMSVAVLAGNAMIGARWAENTDDVGITIAGNSSSSPRIDSIFLHIDTGMDTRAAGVVYRQGTAAGTPTAPAMVRTDNITELRLADILVAPSAAIITQANITDQRGGSDCPWVAGLIQQVDTSALFDQYRAAYAEQQQEQSGEWRTFMDHLARDYDISMSLRKHESTYTSTAAASLIPINIDGYDTTKDLLQVFINGIFAVEGTHYIVKSAAQIQLTNAISAGQKVHFVIYKAVMGGAQPIIPTDEQVQDAVDAYMDAHPGALVVDPELSDTSTHAIQNKAVAAAFTAVNGRLTEQNTKFTSIAGKYYGVVASASAAETKGISDLNDLENGSSVMLVWNTVSADIANFPTNFATGAFIYTKTVVDARTTTASNMVQYAIGTTGEIATRAKTGGNWKTWKYYANRDIYDTALQHYGYCYSANNVVAPYDDCNTLPKNGVYTYVGFDARGTVSNYPAEFTTGATIITFSGATNDYGNAQIAVETGTAFRIAFRILRQPTKWTPWSYIQSSNMQNMVDFSMFEDFGVIGDSFASGSTYHNGAWIDNGYPHSWGQVLARMTGSKCVNYSKGGLSTRTWLTDSMGLPLLLSKPAHQLYILALGINDATLTASAYLGEETDMDDPENHDTFYGNYAKIINSVRSHAPNAKIMLMEILGSAGDRPQFNVAVRNIAEYFDIPLIVPSKSYYMTTGIFWSTMSNGHPIAATYAGMAKALKGIIEDLIASSPTDYAVIPTSNYVE